MSGSFRALRREVKNERRVRELAAIVARRRANRRLFWKLIAGSFAVSVIAGAALVVVLISVVK